MVYFYINGVLFVEVLRYYLVLLTFKGIKLVKLFVSMLFPESCHLRMFHGLHKTGVMELLDFHPFLGPFISLTCINIFN